MAINFFNNLQVNKGYIEIDDGGTTNQRGIISYGVNGKIGQTTSWTPDIGGNPGLWVEGSNDGESGGIFMNGNTFALWSPGDQSILKIYDEDNFSQGPLYQITGLGISEGQRFASISNNAYYLDPDGDSQLNTLDIDDYVRHRGDTNTYIGFPADDTFTVTTANSERIRVNSDGSIQQANSSATGQYAAAFGQNNTSNQLDSFATGENTTASGRQSFSGGFNTTASGSGSFAHGASTLAQGTNSFAAGAETEAIGTGSAAFNNQTNATGINSFAIGGNTTASGEASFASGVSTLSQGIGSVSSGLSTNAAANGTHVSGVASTATGLFSSAQGDNCLAQGQASVAMGYIAEARGNFGSAAIGFNVDANGQSSLAVNQQNAVQGNNSIAGGFQTNIDSNESMGMGFHCKSQASTLRQDNQFLFGRYLNAPQSAPAVQAGQSQFIVGRHNAYLSQQHTAFAVGNGAGIGTESNAMTVLYNGRVGIGTTAPTSTLHVIGDILSSSGASFGGNTDVQGSLRVGDNVGSATAASAGSIRYRTTSNSSHVDMAMQTGASTYAWVNIVTNTW